MFDLRLVSLQLPQKTQDLNGITRYCYKYVRYNSQLQLFSSVHNDASLEQKKKLLIVTDIYVTITLKAYAIISWCSRHIMKYNVHLFLFKVKMNYMHLVLGIRFACKPHRLVDVWTLYKISVSKHKNNHWSFRLTMRTMSGKISHDRNWSNGIFCNSKRGEGWNLTWPLVSVKDWVENSLKSFFFLYFTEDTLYTSHFQSKSVKLPNCLRWWIVSHSSYTWLRLSWVRQLDGVTVIRSSTTSEEFLDKHHVIKVSWCLE